MPANRDHDELHVEPTARGRWVVCYEHRQRPLSQHATASAAETDALRRAHTEHIARVLLHDCYTRVHELTPSPRVGEPRGVSHGH